MGRYRGGHARELLRLIARDTRPVRKGQRSGLGWCVSLLCSLPLSLSLSLSLPLFHTQIHAHSLFDKDNLGGHARELLRLHAHTTRVTERERERVWVCGVSERECVGERVCERGRVCVCVCVREREGERVCEFV